MPAPAAPWPVSGWLEVHGAREHNLRGVDVRIPRHALTVVTGPSGSGKSSLAFDTIFREGQRRYLAALSSFARQYLGKLHRPQADHFAGLPPALAVDQRTTVRNPRSTVGTLTEVYDHLRLLFARAGQLPGDAGDTALHLGLFSFNTAAGACPACHGLAVTDEVDPDLLVADPARSLRKGALVPTTPSGYIVYSQVTIDVLDQVCRAHGFDVDTPWQALTDEQRQVIFFGSRARKVPFGKHPLESRLRWSGITARPREAGYYKGLIPTIRDAVARNRNKNALRFVRSQACTACAGTRLQPVARRVRVGDATLPELLDLPLTGLRRRLAELALTGAAAGIAAPILQAIDARLALLLELGLGYLQLGRESTSLSGGEAQRIRLAGQVGSGLHGLLYVLDEPSIGLHPSDTHRLLAVLRRLRDLGNTVLCVEHDADTIAAADYLVDLGPGAGRDGGAVLYQGPATQATASPTWQWLAAADTAAPPARDAAGGAAVLRVRNVRAHNLRGFDASFHLGALNVVTGVSGAGKSTLVEQVLVRALRRHLQGTGPQPGAHDGIDGLAPVRKVIAIDAAPIGRTPRSNPATYTGVFDRIRDLFAALPAATAAGLGKGDFSINVVGGRCETCQGAGQLVIGMHGLADVEVPCSACGGRRFQPHVLAVRYGGHDIADLLAMPVEQARGLFADQPAIQRVLTVLCDLGLGYIQLGQPATTFSGGEAQRIKLASELARPTGRGHTVYILDEPTTGLHGRDVAVLSAALERLVAQGHTVILVEHDRDLIRRADHVLDLGPGAGAEGGRLVYQGPPNGLPECPSSATGRALAAPATPPPATPPPPPPAALRFCGVTTNNLRDLDVTIPHRALTVIAGVSGSGKSSLAFDTIFAEARRRFADNLTTQTRRYLPSQSAARFATADGLTPAVAVRQDRAAPDPRSTVGTLTGIQDYLRLLYARAGRPRGDRTARMFSFNHPEGACPTCGGAGRIAECDPDKLVTDPSRSLFDGALDGHKTGRHYGERDGRYLAILAAVEQACGVDLHRPYQDLDDDARQLAMYGCGERQFDVTWYYRRGQRRGEHRFTGPFPGLARYVDEEYQRKQHDRRGEAIRSLLTARTCPECDGSRLRAESRGVTCAGHRLAALGALPVQALLDVLDHDLPARLDPTEAAIAAQPVAEIRRGLGCLLELGLGHLALGREATTLSGGELQRVRLATQLATRMTGVTYVLDEPTVGLHPYDTDRLLACIRRLLADDGTVIAVEHDPQVWAAADHVLVLGPGAGSDGGTIVASGAPHLVRPPVPPRLPPRELPSQRIRLRGADRHNLAGLDVALPPGCLVAITGVSGSGKSTLAGVLADSAAADAATGCSGFERPARLAAVVRTRPPAAAHRHGVLPVTRLAVFDRIRKLFASTPRARELGLPPAAFSCSAKAGPAGGRCESCQGLGRVRTDMEFLADVWHTCEACDGQRFTAAPLSCRWQGLNIAELLALSIAEALDRFADQPAIRTPLELAARVGLGYLALGQSGATLSGGEWQRLELAAELQGGRRDRSGAPRLYVLDEPTTGLHTDDVGRLLPLLRESTDAGHTVVMVEHDLDVVRNCDWVIDLGPGGGSAGGQLLYAGPPAGLASCKESRTGRFL